MYVSSEEKVLRKKLEVALECCREEFGDHGHSHGHGHSHEECGHCDEHGDHEACCGSDCHDCGHDASYLQQGSPLPATGTGATSDEDLDSDEELLRMGIDPNGDIIDSADDEDTEAGPGPSRSLSASALNQQRRRVIMRTQIASSFTRDVTELQAVRLLATAAGVATAASSSQDAGCATLEADVSLNFPVVCLVHRLRAFTEFEPSPLEAALNYAISNALCDIAMEAAGSRGLVAHGHTPHFTFLRVGMARMTETDSPLRRHLAGQSLADLNALPAVVCLQSASDAAVVLAGPGRLETCFGRGIAMVAGSAGDGGRRGFFDRARPDHGDLADEMKTKVRQWLERVGRLSVHSQYGMGLGRGSAGGDSSTHHAASAATEKALRRGQGVAGDSDEEDAEEENRFCGRRGCATPYMHKHIDAAHLGSAHNRKTFLSNEFH